MAKKPAKPARKSPAKPKAAPARKKSGSATAARKPAAKKTVARKAARPAARKPAAKPKSGASARKASPAAKKPVAKARPLPKAKPKAAPKTVARPATPIAAKKTGVGRSEERQAARAKSRRTGRSRKLEVRRQAGGETAAGATCTGAAGAGKKPTPSEIAARIAGKRAEDATKKGKNGKQAEIAPRVLTPADVEARKRRLKTLIVLGKERGFLTFAEVNDHLPDDVLDAEQIEGIISMIGDMGIQVYDEAPDAETLLMSETAPAAPTDDVEEAAEAAVSTLDSEFGRTTDPVRMYMREMGSVELLTREGEIVIAKRIEEGLKHMIMAISACPMTVAQILDARRQDRQGRDQDRRPGRRPDGLQRAADVDRGNQRRQRRGRRRRRRRRHRRREPRAAQGGGARALRDDPPALRADAGRADQGRPQGAEVPRSAEEDLGRADADPLLGPPGRAAVRHRAHRGRQHPPDRAQDPGPGRAQGRHAASRLHPQVPGQRDVAALDRPRDRRQAQLQRARSPSTGRRSSSSSRSCSTCRAA